MKRLIAIIVVLLFAMLVGVQILLKVGESKKAGMGHKRGGAVAVETAPIVETGIRDVGLFTGSLIPRAQFIMSSKITGRLKKINVDVGDEIERDQLVAVIDADEYSAKVTEARATLRMANANYRESKNLYAIASRDNDRIKELHEEGMVSDSKLDSAEAQFKIYDARRKVGSAQVAQAKAALKAAKVALSYTKLKASWEDGDDARVVAERFVDEGTMVMPNVPIVSIMDISTLKAIIYVTEQNYARVAVGQEVIITTDAYTGETFSGEIARIAPKLEMASRKAQVQVEVSNSDGRLKPGMFVRAEIVFEEKEYVTVVPITALARRDNKQGVFLVDAQNKKVKFVPITLGIVNGDKAEVTEPELSGDVVVMGQHLLEDGSKIILPGLKGASQESAVSTAEESADPDKDGHP